MDSILPFLVPQPRPQVTMVNHLEVAGRTVSSITRRWADGDTRRCMLCPSCCAYDGVCNIMVDCRVSLDEAKGFDANGCEFQPDGTPDVAGRRNTPWSNN